MGGGDGGQGGEGTRGRHRNGEPGDLGSVRGRECGVQGVVRSGSQSHVVEIWLASKHLVQWRDVKVRWG